jgi:hypothetical protein
MSDPRSKQKLAGVFMDGRDIDVTHATMDTSLAKVWSDENTAEIAVSVDRVLFDSLLDVAARYLEPHGYSLNLENLLATIDGMRLGVFAVGSSKPSSDGRMQAKRLMPHLYMHLPRKNTVGPLLQRFYDEIGRYERELARLHELESKAKKSVEAAIKDDSGKKAVAALHVENAALREELARLGKKLAMAESALSAVPSAASDNQLPIGVRNCVVRSVRVSEGLVTLKSGDSQFSVTLAQIGGLPMVNARTAAYFEGGVLRSAWVFDPLPKPFGTKLAQVMAREGRKLKIRFADRSESLVHVAVDRGDVTLGARVLARFAEQQLVDLTVVEAATGVVLADIIYDAQTKRQIESLFEGVGHD